MVSSAVNCSVWQCVELLHTATHCKTLQLNTTHCNTLKHTATHCNTLHHAATHCRRVRLLMPHRLLAGGMAMGVQDGEAIGWSGTCRPEIVATAPTSFVETLWLASHEQKFEPC